MSFRDVEELLAKRWITVTHETIRQWCRKFGPERRDPKVKEDEEALREDLETPARVRFPLRRRPDPTWLPIRVMIQNHLRQLPFFL